MIHPFISHPFRVGPLLVALSMVAGVFGAQPQVSTAAPVDVSTRSTFHCISLYWTIPESRTCSVQFRPVGATEWNSAQDLWYDRTTETRLMNQYRGSIVNLLPGTRYEIRLSAGTEQRTVQVSTWSEAFKIKKTIRVRDGATFATTEGGSASDGYVLYDGTGATIDQQNLATNGVVINHSHVIVRGLTIRNARHDAVSVAANLSDVVIEGCDISEWGSQVNSAANPTWGSTEAGIKCASTSRRVVIQRNRIHHPRYTSARWNENPADLLPRGPRAVLIGPGSNPEDGDSNHVIRYNEFTSDKEHLFEDVIGGGVTGSRAGSPGSDSDIYGNLITHAADDLIAAEGGGQNVRIWGNYFGFGFANVSLQSCTVGPVYLFRNIFGHSLRYLYRDTGAESGFRFGANARTVRPGQPAFAPFRGRVYIYHNTQLPDEDYRDAFSVGSRDHVRNIISRNNVLPTSRYYLHDMHGGTAAEALNPDFVDCSFDYDLVTRDSSGDSVTRVLGAHIVKAEPRWRRGEGPENGPGGKYQLFEQGPGRNAGVALPNFNLGAREEGGAPDLGAHEFNAPNFQFGVRANWPALPLPGGAVATFPLNFVPPYPPSQVITGVTFDDRTARTEALGSDIWPITWANDDNLYTAWGDGGGFGGTNQVGRVSLGVGRIEGDKRGYRGINIAGGKDAPHPPPFPGKSEGILALGNILYLWRDGDASSLGYFKSIALWRSDDRGATWRETGVRFSKSGGDFRGVDEGIFAPAFCQFGRGYAGARDDYVYVYAPDSIDPSHWTVRLPGRINLLRVPRERIESKEAYEFYAGSPQAWTKDPAKRMPVWSDRTQGTHRIAVSYNPGLKRYLLTTITLNRDGWMSIYDAPEPWGPWTHVHTELNPERWGSYTIIFTFVNKWLSADGRDFVIVHTKDDTWSSIEGRFRLAGDK